MTIPLADDEPLMTVDRVVEVTGGVLGQRSALHEAIRRGEIPSIRIGRRVLVPTQLLRSEVLALDPPMSADPTPQRSTHVRPTDPTPLYPAA